MAHVKNEAGKAAEKAEKDAKKETPKKEKK